MDRYGDGRNEDDTSGSSPGSASKRSQHSIGVTANEIARQANRIAIWAIAGTLLLGIISTLLAYWQGTVRAKEGGEVEEIDKYLSCGPTRIDLGKVSVISCAGSIKKGALKGALYVKAVLEFGNTDSTLWQSCNGKIVVFKGNTQVRMSTSNCLPEATGNTSHSIILVIPSGEVGPGSYRAEATWAGSYNKKAVGSPPGVVGHAISPSVNI